LTPRGRHSYRRETTFDVDSMSEGKPTMKRKVDVSLLGHRFTVKTERDEAWVHGLAAQITRRLEEAKRSMRNASREEQILIVALNLADELFEEVERSASARAELRKHTQQMIVKLSQALGGSTDSEFLDEESDEIALSVERRA
jgi:cell division protein ZapA (FtsZ GTPase activity inhibitor)